MSDLESIQTRVSPAEKLQEYLSTQNKRYTREREIVLQEVFSSHEHFDTDELVSRLNTKDGNRVSRATVYRHLEVMEHAGLLRKVARPNNREVWEHDYGYPQHDHLICEVCGGLTEFHNEAIQAIIQEIAAEHGFLKKNHRLEVYGTCEQCRKPKKRRHRKLDMI